MFFALFIKRSSTLQYMRQKFKKFIPIHFLWLTLLAALSFKIEMVLVVTYHKH